MSVRSGCAAQGRDVTRAAPIVAVVVLVITLGGCAASPAGSASPAASAGPSPAASDAPVRPDVESPSVVANQPPDAALGGLTRPPTPLAGTLGAWTWDERGDAAPWIVPSGGGDAGPGARLEVAFDPALTPDSWIARWARVVGGEPGDPQVANEGVGPPAPVAPEAPGTWSLQLDARFGEGRSGAWYWWIEVGP